MLVSTPDPAERGYSANMWLMFLMMKVRGNIFRYFHCMNIPLIISLHCQGLKRLMTKCQQYFITDPSRSVDFQRQETDPEPETSGESVGVASLREVAFISSKEKEGEATEEEGDKKKDS